MGSRYPSSIGHADHCANHAADSETLTSPGNGRREAFDRHIDDCVDAMLHVCEHADGPLAMYNLGTHTTTSVTRVADELGLDPDYEYTGGDRGWTGDPVMRLSIEKLDALGWAPEYEHDRAVRRATREVIEDLDVAT